MGAFVRGQVVVLPFPSSDLQETERKRPALVLACSGTYSDLIVCMITATRHSTHPVETNFSVEITDSDIVGRKLRKSISYVRPDRIFTAEPTLISYGIGNLTPSKMNEIMNQVALIFGFKDGAQP